MTQREALLHLLADGSVKRAVDLRAAGIRPQVIADALEHGLVKKAATGSYFLSGTVDDSRMMDLAVTCLRMPRALVCLISAAHLCGLTDMVPDRAWLALPVGAYGGKPDGTLSRILRWSFGGAFDVNVVEKDICGVRVRHTGPRRTIVDLLQYGARWGEPTAGILAARKFTETGGDLTDVLKVAETLRPPKATLNVLNTLTPAFS